MRRRSSQILVHTILVMLLAARWSFGADAESRRRTADELVGNGLRRIESKHLVLYTDLDVGAEIDELGQVFDLAIPQWCEFFQIDAQRAANWRMTGYLIKEPERFRSTHLLPSDLPAFLNGYQRGEELWFYEQPSSYYRRHLLLHEGTHGFMNELLGGTGPPWFMEGLAEYLGTHRWSDGQLQLAYVPRDNEEVPHWGRVKIIKDEVAAGRELSLLQVMEFGPRAHLNVEPYAWCWAAVLLMEQHPAFHEALHDALQDVNESPEMFLANMRRRIGPQWNELELNWQVLLAHMEYGYDVRSAMVQTKATSSQSPFTISAKLGWQATGVRLEKGKTYELSAKGRFKIAERSKPWTSEPGGITIHYYHGQPLGLLLAAVVPDDQPEALRHPIPIGLKSTITAEHSGTLLFCVNENPAELHDNDGQIIVEVKNK